MVHPVHQKPSFFSFLIYGPICFFVNGTHVCKGIKSCVKKWKQNTSMSVLFLFKEQLHKRWYHFLTPPVFFGVFRNFYVFSFVRFCAFFFLKKAIFVSRKKTTRVSFPSKKPPPVTFSRRKPPRRGFDAFCDGVMGCHHACLWFDQKGIRQVTWRKSKSSPFST